MLISVASGKGGTGKTTVAVNMALALDGRADLFDCDVEEPNAHLFLQPQMHGREEVTTPVPKIDAERCTLCGECVTICRFNALAVAGKQVLVFPELCHSCGGCLAVCPEGAVSETGRVLGELAFGAREKIRFVKGRMRVGEAMAPPLIRKVRAMADPERITIVDAPPGTSCPVIAAMQDADFVLMVTEPTPFGLHDLRLAVEAVRLLKIPAGLVVNRADMGDDQVFAYAKQENLPVLMRIPFDRRIAEAYSNGRTIIEELPEWRPHFVRLYSDIERIVKENKVGSCVNS
ncbi:MAG: P-loop NTPase [Desulfobulbus sp.]|jgi:MinD superfamily P-loop ATPase